jgi:hypothetical protein
MLLGKVVVGVELLEALEGAGIVGGSWEALETGAELSMASLVLLMIITGGLTTVLFEIVVFPCGF